MKSNILQFTLKQIKNAITNIMLRVNSKELNLYLLLILLAVIIPFNHSASTIDPVLIPQFIALTFTCFFLILFSIRTIKRNSFISIKAPYSFFIIGYLFFVVCSFCQMVNISEGIVDSFKIIIEFIFLMLVVHIISTNDSAIPSIIKAIVAGVFFIEFIGVYQIIKVWETKNALTAITGNMANKNLYASFYNICLYH